MVAAVETMAYVGTVPWHGLGNKVNEDISLEEFQREAGLDWQVQKTPVMFAAPDHERTELGGTKLATFKDKFVLNRTTDHKPFAVVSGRYKPVQPKEIFSFFQDLLAMHSMKMHTAGSLKDGGRIWCLAQTGDVHKVLGTDRVDGYLLLSTSYDLTLSTLAQFTSVRVVCNNTLQQALSESSGRVTIPHVREFNANEIKAQLGIGREQWEAFTNALDVISKIKVDEAMAMRVMDKVFQLPEDFEKRMVDPDRVHATNVVEMFTREKFIGADVAGQTGWGLLNSLTEYVDFRKRARSQSNRIDSAWFGPGAQAKAIALQELVELAA
jgi:phage/plasmid-like protein (TIGR03299 family)